MSGRKESNLHNIERWKGVLNFFRKQAERKIRNFINLAATRAGRENMKTICEDGERLCADGHDIFMYYADLTEALFYLQMLAKWEELDDEEWTMEVEGRFRQFMDLLHGVTKV